MRETKFALSKTIFESLPNALNENGYSIQNESSCSAEFSEGCILRDE